MKAAICYQPGAPDVLRYEDVADPSPGDEDLLVRVEAISIEGGDTIGRQLFVQGGLPQIIGYAASGEVVAIGPRVSGFARGQKVTTFAFHGSHAELRTVPAATCWRVPDGLDMGVAAAIPCGAGTAALALRLGGVQAGETILIQGAAGGVGFAAVQLAHQSGARVLGTATNRRALETLRDYGLSDGILIGPTKTNEQVRRILRGDGVDALIDCIGGPALSDGLLAVKDGGRAVLVGDVGGGHQPIDASHLLMHRKTVIGCLLGAVMGEPPIHEMVSSLLWKAKAGELHILIDVIMPLSEAAAAHARAEERGRLGRVIMRP